MANLNSHDDEAIFIVAVWSVLIIVDIILLFRLSFRQLEGWIYFVVLGILRVVGAGAVLYTINNVPTEDSTRTAIICSAIGISPLTYALAGMLGSINSKMPKNFNRTVFTWTSRLTLAVVVVALIISILGVTQQNSYQTVATSKSKIGIILYLVAFGGVCLLVFELLFNASYWEKGDKRVMFAVVVSLPFLLVRILYSVVDAFSSNPKYNAYGGSVGINVCFQVLEEIIIAIIGIVVGFTLPREGSTKYVAHADAENSGTAKEYYEGNGNANGNRNGNGNMSGNQTGAFQRAANYMRRF